MFNGAWAQRAFSWRRNREEEKQQLLSPGACRQPSSCSTQPAGACMPPQRRFVQELPGWMRCSLAGSAPGGPRALAKQAAMIKYTAPASASASAQPILVAPAGDAPSTSGRSEGYTDMMWRSPSPQGYVAPVIDMQQVRRLAPFLRPCFLRHSTARRGNANNKGMENTAMHYGAALSPRHVCGYRVACLQQLMRALRTCLLPALCEHSVTSSLASVLQHCGPLPSHVFVTQEGARQQDLAFASPFSQDAELQQQRGRGMLQHPGHRRASGGHPVPQHGAGSGGFSAQADRALHKAWSAACIGHRSGSNAASECGQSLEHAASALPVMQPDSSQPSHSGTHASSRSHFSNFGSQLSDLNSPLPVSTRPSRHRSSDEDLLGAAAPWGEPRCVLEYSAVRNCAE